MKDFDSLTRRGKGQRYRKALVEGLQAYPVEMKSIRLMSLETKPVFRIHADSGSYAAKFHDPTEHVLSQMMGELQFLDHIARNSELCVETPLANIHGELVTEVSSSWLPDIAHFAICSWVPGRHLKDELSVRSYRYLGISSAMLHKASLSFEPKSDFRILINDKVFYWDKETILSRRDTALLPSSRQKLFKEGARVAQSAIAKRWNSGSKPIVIHNDLHPCNIKLHKDRLSIYDFEDITWGYAGQDIGTAMYHIRFRKDYPRFLEAYREGYEQVTSWPIESDQQLDSFVIARLLMFANYTVNYNIRPRHYLPVFEKRLDSLLSR